MILDSGLLFLGHPVYSGKWEAMSGRMSKSSAATWRRRYWTVHAIRRLKQWRLSYQQTALQT